ncbi:hypothetical protein C0J52_09835 [Blattella germanica]|nr:hypothetical protein C0J52_09835 [Blattella germanica]
MGTGFDRNIEKLQTQNVSFTRDIAQTVGCSHVRSLSYYIEAINNPNCIFWGKRRLSSDQP